MIAVVEKSSGRILTYYVGQGFAVINDDVTTVRVTLDDSYLFKIQQAQAPPTVGAVFLNNDLTLSTAPSSLPPVSHQPDIAGLINALIASASIDQSTKSALIAALRGQ